MKSPVDVMQTRTSATVHAHVQAHARGRVRTHKLAQTGARSHAQTRTHKLAQKFSPSHSMRGSDAADVEVAQAMFELALDHNPREINSLNSLALILQREGRHVEAQGHYNRALRLAPSQCALHCNYASFLQSVRKGGALFPEDSFLLFNRQECARHNDCVQAQG